MNYEKVWVTEASCKTGKRILESRNPLQSQSLTDREGRNCGWTTEELEKLKEHTTLIESNLSFYFVEIT